MVEITVCSAGRSFAEVAHEGDGSLPLRPTALGMVVCEHVDKIGYFEPAVEVVEKELQTDGLRFVLRISPDAPKPIGEIVRGFKIGCFRIAREYGLISADDGLPIFGPGFAARRFCTVEEKAVVML